MGIPAFHSFDNQVITYIYLPLYCIFCIGFIFDEDFTSNKFEDLFIISTLIKTPYKLTAYYGILANGSVKNKTLLISGGAGAVGFYGIQIAKLAGANVITTISNDEKAKIANNAGADKVINYKNENVFEEVMKYTNSNGVDRIFEVEFGGNLPLNEKIIKPNGVIAAYGSMAKMEPKF